MQLRKRYIANAVSVFFSIIPFVIFGQQEPQFSQYMFNHLGINPGVIGTNEAICAFGLYRQQWLGFEDTEGNDVAPETYTINLDAPIRFLRGGLGLSITSDKLGFEGNTIVKFGYAYHLKVGNGIMGLGAMVSFNDKSVDFSKLKPVDDDPILTQLGKESDMLVDASVGVFYRVPELFYVGISSTQVLQSRGKALGKVEGAEFKMQLRRHYYLTGGYEFTFPGNPAFTVTPSMLFKTDGASFQVDATALLNYKDRFWGGVSYRLQDAIVVMLGVSYKNIRIGYSYDITTSSLGGSYSSGSHEVMAGYCFKLEVEKLRQSYKNTRFL